MSAPHFDAIIVGLGAMGSQAAAHLARRGARVLGLDRFAPPHAWGSSHGRSRIIREAYFEDPRYVPLVQRALENWRALEAETGVRLLRTTGGLCYGPPDGSLVRGARLSAQAHDLPHELLDAAVLRARYPQFRVEDDWVGVLEPRAGMLDPERAIGTALRVAVAHGARLHLDTPVLRWRQEGDGVAVDTAMGTHRAAQLVLAGGMWMRELLPELALPLTVQRNVVYWFTPAREDAAFAPERCPVFLGEIAPGRLWYGFPDTGDGFKVGLHHHGPVTEPHALDRTVRPEEIAALRALLGRWIPWANGPFREAAVCTYTTTPDEHFIIDRHPLADRVWVASPCSGHGFKFASAIGEVLADLVTGGQSRFDLSPFAIGRYS